MLLPVLATSLAACSRSVQDPADLLQGNWKVARVLCDGCSGPVLAEAGKVVTFHKDRITNPTTGDCEGNPGYTNLRSTPAADVASRAGSTLPQEAKTLLPGTGFVQYGFVTCNGVNYLQLAVLPGDQALFFEEGPVVFLANRLK
jgi:hypothetical protein